ncbi:hypothetical protein P3T20_004063 [Paraburkholderia sp. GAS206C]|uniref:toxin-antitoxin system YwqK family antitoxin n=1 Tax=unclassified Paraburkholderia TaxID=2615204 RepID=UPI003D213670
MNMKTFRHRLLLAGIASFMTFGLAACSSKLLDYQNMTVSGGKIYEQGSNTPFSGKVTNVPSRQVFAGAPALDTILKTAADRNGLTYYTAANWFSTVCDIGVKDGYRDGAAACSKADTGVKYFDLAFKGGELDGDVTIYSSNGSGKPAATATVSDGKIDGELKIFSVSNGALVTRAKYREGVLISDEDFDADTGKTVRTFSDDDQGQIDGKMLGYSPDGTLTSYAEYSHGKQTGEAYWFYPDTGKVKRCIDTQTPSVPVTWDENSKLIDNVETEIDQGSGQPLKEPIPQSSIDACVAHLPPDTAGASTLETRSAANPAVDDCVKNWISTYQQERMAQGLNILISNDQTADWRQWCKQGKTPATQASDNQPPSARPAPLPAMSSQTSTVTDACVRSWTIAYQNEREKMGLSESVSDDQLGEWQDWCREGKKPG